MTEYAFGPFSLLPDRFILTGNGKARQLTPRLLAVLHYLIEHRNRVVTKDELIAEVWQGCFVEEANVARTVSSLRALLGDVAEKPKYIRTVSRVGYRFIHPVHTPAGNHSEDRHAFVGRLEELRSLKEMFTKCEQGNSPIVCIFGPAGIGKTALVETLLSDLDGRCIIARSVNAVKELSGKRPVILFIDDFHWADSDTVDLIGSTSLLPGQVRLMLIIAFRTTAGQELQVQGTCHQIPLQPLSFEEVKEYLDATVPDAREKERLAQDVYRRSEGNPFLMVSLLSFLKSIPPTS
jgi:DNA-binding winged helix-turn-helix (wHTH) protein